MKILVITNKSAGTDKNNTAEPNLEESIRKLKLKADIVEAEGADIKQNVRLAVKKGYDVVAVSGGDGSISSAASVLINTDIPLAVIPSGTLNHFAKDLGIPLKTEEALKIIPAMKIKKIDAGEVNGRIFINNSSVGIYPKMVKLRDREIKNSGTTKWIAMIQAFVSVFKKFPMVDVKIKSNMKKVYSTTPIVFIGNNEYKTDIFKVGTRESITEGKLSLFYPAWSGRFTLLRFAMLGLVNRLKEQEEFHTILTEEIQIETTSKEIEVAVDGEVLHLNSPLHYKIHPLALKVIVPEEKL